MTVPVRSWIARCAGRSAQIVLEKVFHRGSTLPGRLALAIDPHVLRHLASDINVIIVTGTNGKTMTTALAVSILEQAAAAGDIAGPVITNPSGANMLTGIVATFLKSHRPARSRQQARYAHIGPDQARSVSPASVGQTSAKQTSVKQAPDTQTPPPGGSPRRYAVLEVDEASVAKVVAYLPCSTFVFTNIFRDQMDRYGEIYTTYQLIVDAAAAVPDATIILNADSPLFQSVALVNPVKTYGFDHQRHEPRRAHYNTDGVLCPRCHSLLKFTMNTYANLGNYLCPTCDFRRPPLDVAVTHIGAQTPQASQFTVTEPSHVTTPDHVTDPDRTGDHSYTLNVGGLYNIYNALSAIALAQHLGISQRAITAGIQQSTAAFGRLESFHIPSPHGASKQVTIVLIKNPVGAGQAFDLINLATGPLSLVALLNANYADGIDTSWIWDAPFEQLASADPQEQGQGQGQVAQVVAGGSRHHEMARRLRVAGFDQVADAANLESIVDFVRTQATDHTYIVATYTAMLRIRELFAAQGWVHKELR